MTKLMSVSVAIYTNDSISFHSMCAFLQLLQVEHRDAKKSKSWRSRLSGLFKREKKANEKDDTGGRDAGSAKTKGKTQIKVSEAQEGSAKGVCTTGSPSHPPA